MKLHFFGSCWLNRRQKFASKKVAGNDSVPDSPTQSDLHVCMYATLVVRTGVVRYEYVRVRTYVRHVRTKLMVVVVIRSVCCL